MFNKYGVDKAHIPLQKLDGGYAVAVADGRKPNSLVLAKGWSSPLMVYKFENSIIWASTKKTIQDAFRKTFNFEVKWADIEELEVGEMLLLEHGNISELEFKPYEDPNKYIKSWSVWDGDTKQKKKYTTEKTNEFTKNYHSAGSYKKKSGPWIACNSCRHLVQWEDTWQIGGYGEICDDCYFGDDYRNVPAAEKVEDKTKEDGYDYLEEEHQVVCELVGEKHGVTADYVDWLLFDSSISEGTINNLTLTKTYEEFSEDYDMFYEELMDEKDWRGDKIDEIVQEETEEEDEEIALETLPLKIKRSSLGKWRRMVGL